jgi:anti-sigma B factor antagonist
MTQNGAEYTFTLDGRLDTMTSPKLNSKINEIINDADKLVMDLKELEFISSAGLRVLLGALQAIEDKGEMVVINLSPAVREVFDLTGFSRLFKIK